LTIIYEPRGRAREYAPLAVNLYSGCEHGCLYCYAPAALRRRPEEFHGLAVPRLNILERLRKEAERRQGPREQVLLCFTCDPYPPTEREHGTTRRAIEILHEHGWTVQILTKGGTRACRDFDLLGAADAFATTLTFLDPERSLEWEPRAALPADRIDAIRKAHSAGIPTWVSLEPVIDPAEALEIIRRTHEVVDLYKVGPLNYHPATAGVDWRAFGQEVEALLRELGKGYYLKEDLRKHMTTAAS
jgi:DNA repair photolyase